MSYLFYNMAKIKSIDFTHFDSTEVTDMGSLFSGCNGLEAITFGGNFNVEKVYNMSHLFERCSSLPSINLSNFRTILVNNMSHLFSRCN